MGKDEWDPKGEPQRANTFESRLGRATAVGMYPAGATPQGAMDMAGTVWEWCLNKFETPEETASRANDLDPRVLRGGSWYGNAWFCRAASRYDFHPLYRYHYLGVRVCCGAPME